jgi:hypothetical protein
MVSTTGGYDGRFTIQLKGTLDSPPLHKNGGIRCRPTKNKNLNLTESPLDKSEIYNIIQITLYCKVNGEIEESKGYE